MSTQKVPRRRCLRHNGFEKQCSHVSYCDNLLYCICIVCTMFLYVIYITNLTLCYTRSTFTWYLITSSNINNIYYVVCQLTTEVSSQVVCLVHACSSTLQSKCHSKLSCVLVILTITAKELSLKRLLSALTSARFNKDHITLVLCSHDLTSLKVSANILSDCSVRASSSFNSHDTVCWQCIVSCQELSILTCEDVICYCSYAVLVTQSLLTALEITGMHVSKLRNCTCHSLQVAAYITGNSSGAIQHTSPCKAQA
jgi:hypothetical protein